MYELARCLSWPHCAACSASAVLKEPAASSELPSGYGKGTKAALLLAERAVQMLEIQPALTYQECGGGLLQLLIV